MLNPSVVDTMREAYDQLYVYAMGRGRDPFVLQHEGMLFDIGYADGVKPVLAIPESPVPDGTRAG